MALDYDYQFKIVLLGDISVGKSSLILRFADDTFSESYMPTIGIDFKIRTLQMDRKMIKLQVWDTSGQEMFRTISANYYRGAMGVVVVYDVTNMKSFQNIHFWLNEANTHDCDPNARRVLVGSKCDLMTKKVVDFKTGKEVADQLGMEFIETSAKDATNVDQAFFCMAQEIMKIKLAESAVTEVDSGPQSFRLHDLSPVTDEEGSTCGC